MNGDNQYKPGAHYIPMAVAVGVGVTAAATFYGVIQLGGKLRGDDWTPGNPLQVVANKIRALLSHKETFSTEHLIVAAAFGIVLFAVGLWILLHFLRKPSPSSTLAKAQHLSTGSSMSAQVITEKSSKGGLTTGEQTGLFLVRSMKTGKDRFIGWREGAVIEVGPGGGKTTALAIPQCLEAPGVLICTSNKRDLPDGIRHGREQVGTVWVFDPQRIANYEQTWWINPLRYVTDEVRAHKLATVWMESGMAPGAQKDAFFDTVGPQLLSGMILAAAADNLPITQVFLWLTNVRNEEPVKILRRHGYELPAAAMHGIYNDPDEQRAGVFGTAAKIVSFLNNRRVLSWVTDDGTGKTEFIAEDFVRSGHDTLISLSKEGVGSTGPLTASLTVAVLDAAEEYADTLPHGRLSVPMIAVLDEAPNVCRIQELPNLYSHYGSRGITLATFIQNWAQGCRAWGKEGMEQMWSAATVRVVGSGQADNDHLRSVSALIGEHRVMEYSSSSSAGKSSSSTRSVSQKEKPVFTVDGLMAMKVNECVVFPAGDRAFVGQMVPWWLRPEMNALVIESRSKYGPGITEAVSVDA